MAIEGLQPASKQEVGMYMPYYQGTKRNALPYMIALYKRENLEGERKIEGSENISFLATWNSSSLPADITRCRVQFAGDAELTYEVTMAAFEFVDYLYDVLHSLKMKSSPDFSKGFYRKLLRMDE
jgi:hypothetical protein